MHEVYLNFRSHKQEIDEIQGRVSAAHEKEYQLRPYNDGFIGIVYSMRGLGCIKLPNRKRRYIDDE